MARGSVFGLTRFGLVGLTVIALSATCTAQQPAAASRAVVQSVTVAPLGQATSKPGIIIVAKNSTEILGDIELLFLLANSKAQYKTLYDNLFDLFLTGVDKSQPVVISGTASKKIGNNEIDMTTSVPIPSEAQFKKFKNALKDLDLKTKPTPGPEGVFPVGGNVLANGFLRYSPTMKYAHLATNQIDLVKINRFNFDPIAVLGSDDIVCLVDNTLQTKAERKQNFDRIRKETLGTIKAKPTEAPEDFALRKQAFELQFNELERFFVESERIRISLTTDAAAKKTNIQVQLKALPDTPLAESIEMMTKINAFYSEATVPGSIVQLFLNFPIDAMRKKHILDYVKLARPRARQRIIENKNRTEAQRQTDADIADLMLDVLEGFGGLDSLNGFMQMVPVQDGKYTVIGGGRLSDGKKFMDGIKKFADSRPDKVKLNVETIGKDKDLAVHTLHIPTRAAKIPQLFGKDAMVYIVTGPKSMWYASGENALKTLKDLIDQSEKAGSKPVDTMIKLDTRLLPAIEILDAQIKANPPAPPPPPPPGTKAPRKPKVEGEMRRMALETFANGKDIVHMSLARTQPLTVEIQITAEEGILTFFGKAGAKFVKETLE